MVYTTISTHITDLYGLLDEISRFMKILDREEIIKYLEKALKNLDEDKECFEDPYRYYYIKLRIIESLAKLEPSKAEKMIGELSKEVEEAEPYGYSTFYIPASDTYIGASDIISIYMTMVKIMSVINPNKSKAVIEKVIKLLESVDEEELEELLAEPIGACRKLDPRNQKTIIKEILKLTNKIKNENRKVKILNEILYQFLGD